MIVRLLLTFSAMVVCSATVANTHQQQIVAAVIDLPPYGCKQGNISCYHNRFFSGLESRLSQKIEQITLPYARAVLNAKTGGVGLILVGRHAELEANAINIGTLYKLEFSLISKLRIKNLDDLEQYRIGAIRSTKSTISRITTVNFTNLYEVENFQVALEMMRKGRLDAFFAPIHSAKLLAPDVTAYLGKDFNLPPWILEVVLYCNPKLCTDSKKAAFQHELKLLSKTFSVD